MNVATSECNLTFALNASGALVSVDDVPRGAACGCTCPGCGSRLIAAQGEILAWHFRHESDADCATGYETMAHLLAKEIISTAGLIKVPALIARHQHLQKMVVPEKFARLGKVTREVWWDGIRPDAMAVADGRQLAIEILVTHRTESEKAEVFRARDTHAIEIDLSAFRHGLQEKPFRDAVLISASRRWLYHGALVPALAELQDLERQEHIERARQLEAEAKRKEAAELAHRKQLHARRQQEIVREAELEMLASAVANERVRAAEDRMPTPDRYRPTPNDWADRLHLINGIEHLKWDINLTEFQWLDRLYAASFRAHKQDIGRSAVWMRTPREEFGGLSPMEIGKTADGYRKCMEQLPS